MAKNIGNSAALSNLIVQIVLSSSLALLWGLINILQMVVHFPLLNVTIPQNAKVFYEALQSLANFDLLPKDEISEFMRKAIDSEEDDANVENEGKDDVNALLSRGTVDAGYERSDGVDSNLTLILGISVLCLVLVIILLLWICFRKSQKVRTFVLKIKRKIFFNSIIRSFLETSLETILMSMIATYDLSFDSFGESFSSCFAILKLALFALFVFWVPFFL